MFPFLFRIGPIFIFEVVLAVIGVSELLVYELLPCYGYTFVELALQLFLIEIIVVLRLILRDKQLRLRYISKIVFATKNHYLLRLFWNTCCIGGVMVGLIYWMIKEGLTLSDNKMRNESKIYTLYPLCFFSDLTDHPESGEQFIMVISFLYSCNVMLNLFLIALAIRSFYLHSEKIKRNRTYFKQNSVKLSESLIDSTIIDHSLNHSLIDSKYSNQHECGICLTKFCNQKIIKLRCSHFFHSQCIILWINKNDSCPYRCI